MATKDKERQKEHQRKWYLNNKAKCLANNTRKRERLRQWLKDYKDKPCMDCGTSYPYYVMDLDHRPGEIKMAESMGVLVSKLSFKNLQNEVLKCDLVCANCHRHRTHQRANGDNSET